MLNLTALILSLGVTSLLAPPPGVNLDCLTYFESVLEGKVPLKQLITYERYSGHGFNQLGQYHGCLNTPSSAYYTCWLEAGGEALPLYVGLCKDLIDIGFTDKCNAREVETLIN